MKAQCPNCAKQFAVKPELFGKKVKCPCGKVMAMPAGPKPAPAAPAPATSAPIIFQCNTCHKSLRAPATAAGKAAKCSCGAKNQIPSSAPVATAYPITEDPIVANDPFAAGPAPTGSNDPFASNDPLAENDPFAMPEMSYAGNQVVSTPEYLKPKPKPRKKVKKKKKRASESQFDWLAVGQIVLGVVLLLIAIGLFMMAIGADRQRARSYRGIIFLGFLGTAAICKGLMSAIQSI